MHHEDGNDNGFLKQLATLALGVVFRLVVNFVTSLFTRKKQEVKDEPPEKPGC